MKVSDLINPIFADMIIFPNAKINLGLRIVEKRPDGFHDLESVFYPAGLCDALEVVESEKEGKGGISLTVSGLTVPGSVNENICVKAYELLRKDHFIPSIKVHLHKVIPTGAGLGGGSSDAVAFIKLLDKKFELNLSWGEMHHYAKQLGSDCSFFVGNQPSFAIGKGDDVEKINLDLSGYFLVIIHPGVHVSTAEAFAGIVPAKPDRILKEDILKVPVKEWKNVLKNDFEVTIFKKYPAVAEIKEKLYAQGAIYASMSGSGSAVFGLFENEVDLKKEFPGYFIWQGKA
jgi:4-diphosphocytidyl-2-C-methyl-D-erythritol kinase